MPAQTEDPNLSSYRSPVVTPASSMLDLAIDEKGRIRLPGFPAGLSINEYLPLVHLYASVLEADRLLDCYRPVLGMRPTNSLQAPLTDLSPSTRTQNLFYKREDQTVTRAYKVRGAVVGMAKVMESNPASGFLAVSTGNHALGVLKAAELLRPDSVRIVVPANTAAAKMDKITAQVQNLLEQGVRASLVYAGETFDEARDWAMTLSDGEYYLDPYSDPWVVAGQGTIGLELFRQTRALVADRDIEEVMVISPIGGGGLLAGTATAFKMAAAWDQRFRNVDLRFTGLRLENQETLYGDAIRVNDVAEVNRKLLDSLNVAVMPINDNMMAEGMLGVKDDLGVTVEGPSGGTLYPALRFGACMPTRKRMVVCILSGGNASAFPSPVMQPRPLAVSGC